MDPNYYNFKVDDRVITTFGEVGRITNICTCDSCARRGFYEPKWVEDGSGNTHYITAWDPSVGFSGYYQIGEHKWCKVLNKQLAESKVVEARNMLKQWEERLRVINELERGGVV